MPLDPIAVSNLAVSLARLITEVLRAFKTGNGRVNVQDLEKLQAEFAKFIQGLSGLVQISFYLVDLKELHNLASEFQKQLGAMQKFIVSSVGQRQFDDASEHLLSVLAENPYTKLKDHCEKSIISSLHDFTTRFNNIKAHLAAIQQDIGAGKHDSTTYTDNFIVIRTETGELIGNADGELKREIDRLKVAVSKLESIPGLPPGNRAR